MAKRDPWKVTLGVVAGAILLACGGGATTSGGGSEATAPKEEPGLKDVTITSCAVSTNEFIGPEAKLKITNNSSKPSNYLITVAFNSPDGATQYDTGSASVSNLAPGQTAEETASSLKSETRAKAKAGMTCKVTNVTRFAS